jgi:hypothetical protein
MIESTINTPPQVGALTPERKLRRFGRRFTPGSLDMPTARKSNYGRFQQKYRGRYRGF